MSVAGQITKIDPPFGVPGGEVIIDCRGFDTSDPSSCAVVFNSIPATLVALGPKRILAVVPDGLSNGDCQVRLQVNESSSQPAPFTVGKRIATEVHNVANPAFDPDDGSLFVTRSGSRGEELPVTLFRVDVDGEVTEYSGDIANPTGIAFSADGEMFVSSRLDGVVYRITPFKEAQAFARNLGVATGIAFDLEGTLYIGDRTGTIFKVSGIGEEKSWAQLEPSVSAYHLAFGPNGDLFVTGPTVSSFDSVWRVNKDGVVSVFYKGLGRPQGLAFDQDGNLYVAASLRGRRGIVRIAPNGDGAEIVVAGVNLIGLAFSASGEMFVASVDSVFNVPFHAQGILLRQ